MEMRRRKRLEGMTLEVDKTFWFIRVSDKVEKKKGKKMDEVDVDGERIFRCGEDGCDYKTNVDGKQC